MKYIALLLISLFLIGCGDIAITTTSEGGSSNTPDPIIVQPVIVEVPK